MPRNENKVDDEDRMNAALAIAELSGANLNSLSVPVGKPIVSLSDGDLSETLTKGKGQGGGFKSGHVQTQMMPSRQKNIVRCKVEMQGSMQNAGSNLSYVESSQGIDLSGGDSSSVEEILVGHMPGKNEGRYVRTSTAWFGQGGLVNSDVSGCGLIERSLSEDYPSAIHNQGLQILPLHQSSDQTLTVTCSLPGTSVVSANLLKVNSVPNVAFGNLKGPSNDVPAVRSGLPPVAGGFLPQNNDEVYLQNFINQSPPAAVPIVFVAMPMADGSVQCIPLNVSLVNSLAMLNNLSQAGPSRVPASQNALNVDSDKFNVVRNEISEKTVGKRFDSVNYNQDNKGDEVKSFMSVSAPVVSEPSLQDSLSVHHLPGSLSSLRDFYNSKVTLNVKSESGTAVSVSGSSAVTMTTAPHVVLHKSATDNNLQNFSGNNGNSKKMLSKVEASMMGKPIDLSKTNGLSQSRAVTKVIEQIPVCSQGLPSSSTLGSLDSLRSFYLRQPGQSNDQAVVSGIQGNMATILGGSKGNSQQSRINYFLNVSNGNVGVSAEPTIAVVQKGNEPKLISSNSQEADGPTVLDISLQPALTTTNNIITDESSFQIPIQNPYSPPVICTQMRILPKIDHIKKAVDGGKTVQRQKKKISENKDKASSPKKKKVPTATLR